MKRKLVIATMALILCGTPALTSVILPVKAEAVETAADSEETDTSAVSEEATPDFSKLAGTQAIITAGRPTLVYFAIEKI